MYFEIEASILTLGSVKIDCTMVIHESKPKRKYELKRRAADMAETRRRITEAAVELHGTVGPARTTVTSVAERAGVQRHTLYRHFPTDADLFEACSVHFFEANPQPDLDAWRVIGEPGPGSRGRSTSSTRTTSAPSRCTTTSTATASSSPRSSPRSPRSSATWTRRPASSQRAGRAAAGGASCVTAALRHAIDFPTWHSLVPRGRLTRAQAVRLASALVESASSAHRLRRLSLVAPQADLPHAHRVAGMQLAPAPLLRLAVRRRVPVCQQVLCLAAAAHHARELPAAVRGRGSSPPGSRSPAPRSRAAASAA